MRAAGSHQSTILVNGRAESCIDPLDRGFQYGDGVFTSLRIVDGAPLFLGYHLERLRRDCQQLAIPFVGSGVLREDSLRLIRERSQGVLKIQITRGLGGRGYRPPEVSAPQRIVALHAPAIHPAEYPVTGIQARYCRTRLGINPALAGVKHMNRLEQILARAEWPDGPIAEGLMLDSEGFVVEGTQSNLFLAQGDRLLTPLLDRCGVNGVMRAIILEAAATLGFTVSEGRVSRAKVEAADEIFITNSIIGLWPVSRLEQQSYVVGPVTLELAEWLKKTIRQAINAWPAG